MRHNNSKRTRGRSGRRPGPQTSNRSYDSNGPTGKLRGTPAQLSEKYQALARDARAGRDRVLVESYFQHAEHYQRLANEIAETQAAAAEKDQRQPRPGGDRETGRENSGSEPTATPQPNVGSGDTPQPKANGADQNKPPQEATESPSEKSESPRRAPRRKRRPAADAPAKEAEQVSTEQASTEKASGEETDEAPVVAPVEAAG